MTLFLWKKEFVSRLSPLYPSCEAEGLFFRVVEHFLGMDRLAYSLEKDNLLSDPDAQKMEYALGELCTGRPLQYIMGVERFYGREFRVDPRVLIPRGETEELVALVLSELGTDVKTVLDVGVGSGAIAVTIALERPLWEVDALDISSGALEVARENARRLDARVDFFEGDILDRGCCDRLGRYDIVVSNPPYVREDEKAGMRCNVLDYEPAGALFVPDGDPFLFYRAVGRFAWEHLSPGGSLFFEINEALGEETAELVRGLGFDHVHLMRDINGKNRMVKALKNDRPQG